MQSAIDTFSFFKAQTIHLVDKLGCPIDPKILDVVAALRMHGIHTISSCEGHADRPTGGPYVMFESPKTRELREKYRSEEKGSKEYKFWHKKAVQENMPEIKKMLLLLEGFYKDRIVANDQHLIVRSFDSSIGELMCQSADIAYALGLADRKALLARNQAEMQAFEEYLKLASPAPHESEHGGALL